MSVHTSSPQIHHPGQFSPLLLLPHPSKWSNVVGTSSCSGTGKADCKAWLFLFHTTGLPSWCGTQHFLLVCAPWKCCPLLGTSVPLESVLCPSQQRKIFLLTEVGNWICPSRCHCRGDQVMDLHQPAVSFYYFLLLGPNLWINLILVSYMFHNVFYTGYEYFIKSFKACRHLHGKWIFKLKVLRGKGQEQTKFSQKVLPLQMKRKCSKLLDHLEFCTYI